MVLNFLFKVINTRMNTFELYVDNSNMFDNVCVSRPISPMFTRYPLTLLERKFNFHITVDLHITFSRHVLNNFKLLCCFFIKDCSKVSRSIVFLINVMYGSIKYSMYIF